MPTITRSRYATMSATQVIQAVARLVTQYAAEDAARRERNARILSAL